MYIGYSSFFLSLSIYMKAIYVHFHDNTTESSCEAFFILIATHLPNSAPHKSLRNKPIIL